MNNRLNRSLCLITRLLFILICAAFLSSCAKLWHPQLDILEEAEGDWICKSPGIAEKYPDAKYKGYRLLRIEKGLQKSINASELAGPSMVFYAQTNASPPTENAGWLNSVITYEGMTFPVPNTETANVDFKYSLKIQDEMLIISSDIGTNTGTMTITGSLATTATGTGTGPSNCKRFRYRRTEIDELLGAIKSAALKTQKLQSLKNNESFLMCASVKPAGHCAYFKAKVCNDSNEYGEHADAVAMALLPVLERNGCIDGGFYPPGEFNESTADDRYAIWMKLAYGDDSVRNTQSTSLSYIANSSLPVTSTATTSVLSRAPMQQEATDAAVPSQALQTQPTATEVPASNKSQNALSTYTGKFSYSTDPNALDEGEVCFYPNQDSSNIDPRKDTSHDFWFCLRNTDTAKAILRIPSSRDPTVCSYEGTGSVTVFDYYEAVNIESDEFDYATLRMASADTPVAKKCE